MVNFNKNDSDSKNYATSYRGDLGAPLINNGPEQSSVGVGATVGGSFGAVDVGFAIVHCFSVMSSNTMLVICSIIGPKIHWETILRR